MLVPIGKVDSLDVTLKKLPKTLHVHIVCRKEDQDEVKALVEGNYPNKISVHGAPIAHLDTDNSIFVIYAGQILHEDTGKVLFHNTKNIDVAYTDKDYLVKNSHQFPVFFPDWNPDLQLSTAYIRSGVWFRNQSDLPLIISNHSQVVAEWIAACYINKHKLRIARIAYSLVHETESRKFNYNSYATTLEGWIDISTKIEVDSEVGMLRWKWQHGAPLVSIIIPTYNAKNLVKQCIDSILESAYENLEIILIDNRSDDEDALAYFNELDTHSKIKLIQYDKPFNYSAINNFAVTCAKGDIIGLVNNDIKALNANWLEHMVSHVMREDIGCVGAKLLYEDDSVQHAGVVLGYGGGAGHAFKYYPYNHLGYIKRLIATNNYSAVTAACLLVKKSDYEAVGGLNEKDLSIAFNDVDFCLRIEQLGRRNLYCAEAELYHYESVSRGLDIEPEKRRRFESELKYLQTSWSNVISNDPAYNPNLTLKRENFAPKTKSEFKDKH